MNRRIALLAVSLFALTATTTAFANTQQGKMKTCNVEAKAQNLSGDERKTFMKECLSKGAAPTAKKGTPQQEKMKSCNAEAKTKSLKGSERKKFMSECLSG